MTAKEYLSQAFVLKKLIAAKRSRIEDLQDKLGFVGAASQGVKVQASLRQDPMGDLSAALLDLIAECKRDIERLLEIEKEIEAVINTVKRDDLRLILYERYVNCKRWEDVAAETNWSWDTVHRKHRLALTKIKIKSYTTSMI